MLSFYRVSWSLYLLSQLVVGAVKFVFLRVSVLRQKLKTAIKFIFKEKSREIMVRKKTLSKDCHDVFSMKKMPAWI